MALDLAARVKRLEEVLEQHLAQCELGIHWDDEQDLLRDLWQGGEGGWVIKEAVVEELPVHSPPVCCSGPGSQMLPANAANAKEEDPATAELLLRVERLEQLLARHAARGREQRAAKLAPPTEETDQVSEVSDADGVSNRIFLPGSKTLSERQIGNEQSLSVLPAATPKSESMTTLGKDRGHPADEGSPDFRGSEGEEKGAKPSPTGGLNAVSTSWVASFASQWGGRKSVSAISISHVEHSLQESFWDALLLLGLPEIGMMGSIMIALGVLCTMGMQLLFCWIVSTSLLSDDDKYNLDYLREWRIYYGHSVHSYDHTSGASLVSKVCMGRPFEREWWNNALLSEVDAYLKPVFPGSDSFPVGVVLTSMAIVIWFCFIAAELDTVAGFSHAIYQLPRTGKTTIELTEFGRRSMVSISNKRLIILTFMVLSRVAIALTLGISAGLWLSRTRDVNDILRDGVSLIFVLEIDDLVYKVLAPAHAKKYLSSIQKFVVKQRQETYIFNIASLAKLLGLVAAIVLFTLTSLTPNALQATAVRDQICGGNLDFVYGSHPTLGPIFVTDTEEYNLKNAENMLDGIADLVEDVVFSYDPKEVRDFMWRSTLPRGEVAVKHLPSVTEMQVWLAMSDREAPEETDFGSRSYGTFCEDRSRSFWEGDWLWPTIEALTGATDCESARPFCERRDLPLIRMVCPETCGCVDGGAGLYVDNGCRQLCHQTDAFQQVLSSAPCSDITNQTDLAWQRWWGGFYANERGVWSEDNEMMTFAREGAQGNCTFLLTADWIARTFCQHRQNRPGSLICPEACGCFGSAPIDQELLWCPASCSTASQR